LSSWLDARLGFLAHTGDVRAVPSEGWPTLGGAPLPVRAGSRPDVSWSIPQQQTSDTAPAELQEELYARIAALPGVDAGPSRISVPGARGLILSGAAGPDAAFLVPEVGEFAHLHPAYDGSLHLALPLDQAADVVAKGWGTPHPWAVSRLTAGFTMVFGPRDAEELEVVTAIVAASHAYATQPEEVRA
jgi:phospholipase/carboxylesterase